MNDSTSDSHREQPADNAETRINKTMNESDSRADGTRWTGAMEQYPKQPDDPDLPPEMELHDTEEGMKWAFREIGLRVEVDGDEFVPDSVAPTDGYVVLRKKGRRDGMIDASDDREIRIYADMSSDLLAVGAETDVTGGDA